MAYQTWNTHLVTRSHLGLSSLCSSQCLTFLVQLWPGRIVDSAVHTPTTKQRLIGGIDDHVDLQFGNVIWTLSACNVRTAVSEHGHLMRLIRLFKLLLQW